MDLCWSASIPVRLNWNELKCFFDASYSDVLCHLLLCPVFTNVGQRAMLGFPSIYLLLPEVLNDSSSELVPNSSLFDLRPFSWLKCSLQGSLAEWSYEVWITWRILVRDQALQGKEIEQVLTVNQTNTLISQNLKQYWMKSQNAQSIIERLVSVQTTANFDENEKQKRDMAIEMGNYLEHD